jgi:hypothetical protein
MFANTVAEPPNAPEADQVLPVTFVSTTLPLYRQAAVELLKPKPVVKVAPAIDDAPNLAPPPLYPVVSKPPESPIWIRKLSVPDKDTPSNITVIRFTQAGIEVKSMLVPLVDATAVPEVIPSTAPELIVTLADPSIVTAMI